MFVIYVPGADQSMFYFYVIWKNGTVVLSWHAMSSPPAVSSTGQSTPRQQLLISMGLCDSEYFLGKAAAEAVGMSCPSLDGKLCYQSQ